MTDGFKQACLVKPMHPIESLPLQRLDSLLGAFLANQLRFVKSADRLSRCIVVAVSGADHRGLNSRLQEPLTLADRNVLRAPVAVMDQSTPRGLSCIKRLLQGIKNKVCLHVTANAPAHDKPREHIENNFPWTTVEALSLYRVIVHKVLKNGE